ncbi:hypothetical protein V1511DRAFT_507938 [Dipodascopsis uninucleata]
MGAPEGFEQALEVLDNSDEDGIEGGSGYTIRSCTKVLKSYIGPGKSTAQQNAVATRPCWNRSSQLAGLTYAVAFILNPVNALPVVDKYSRIAIEKRMEWPLNFGDGNDDHEHHWFEYLIILALVCMSGMAAGLTLGLMTLDETQLFVMSRSGSMQRRTYAQKIIPIRKIGHLLLTTLLIATVITNETLPIVTEHIFGNGKAAVIMSTLLIVIFSEIIPQAVCTKYGLAIGAFMAWPVQLLIWSLFIVCWPIAKLLDLILGSSHGTIYTSSELKELILFHSTEYCHGGDLDKETVKVVRGAIDMQNKIVRSAMTRIHDVFMLDIDTILTEDVIKTIISHGHSRIPIYENLAADYKGYISNVFSDAYCKLEQRHRLIGCILMKSLLTVELGTPIRQLKLQKLPVVQENMSLISVKSEFESSRTHMAIVVPSPELFYNEYFHGEYSSAFIQPNDHWNKQQIAELLPVGIITFEDFIEEILEQEIFDEKDYIKLGDSPMVGSSGFARLTSIHPVGSLPSAVSPGTDDSETISVSLPSKLVNREAQRLLTKEEVSDTSIEMKTLSV